MTLRNRKSILQITAAALLLAFMAVPASAYPFKVTKDVSPMENGNFMIKLRVTAQSESIYCIKLIDADESIMDVYAPDGWCVASDGGTFVARTGSSPAGKNTVEFIIYSNLEDVSFTCSAFGLIEQIGNPVSI